MLRAEVTCMDKRRLAANATKPSIHEGVEATPQQPLRGKPRRITLAVA